jgi:hypothetical protein
MTAAHVLSAGSGYTYLTQQVAESALCGPRSAACPGSVQRHGALVDTVYHRGVGGEWIGTQVVPTGVVGGADLRAMRNK